MLRCRLSTSAWPRVLKALGFNSLKAQCFQSVGFKYQLAALHLGEGATVVLDGQKVLPRWGGASSIDPDLKAHTHTPGFKNFDFEKDVTWQRLSIWTLSLSLRHYTVARWGGGIPVQVPSRGRRRRRHSQQMKKTPSGALRNRFEDGFTLGLEYGSIPLLWIFLLPVFCFAWLLLLMGSLDFVDAAKMNVLVFFL